MFRLPGVEELRQFRFLALGQHDLERDVLMSALAGLPVADALVAEFALGLGVQFLAPNTASFSVTGTSRWMLPSLRSKKA